MLSELSDVATLALEMLKFRVDDPGFLDVVGFAYNMGKQSVLYMDDSQVELNLKYCAQWRATFLTIAKEMARLLDKAERVYKVWWAKRYEDARKELLEEQRKEVKDGYRTKGGYGVISGEAITNRVLVENETQYHQWQEHLDKFRQTVNFFDSLADDIKHRGMVLMNINREKGQF